jgi:DNA-binding NarL/FixJ family response regulator
MDKITVLVVDDHTIVRQGLRALLGLHGDLEVVGEAGNGREAIEVARRTQPDVVLMDVAMPRLNGREAARQILEVAPGARVLVLSCYRDEDCVAQMLEAGATGYLLKQEDAEKLVHAIREVRRGVMVLSSVIAKYRQKQQRAALAIESTKPGRLTAREAEVLQLIAEGFTNREIAAELSLSIKTVEKHRQSVMNKLNIHKAAGLTRFFVDQAVRERGECLEV